MSGSTIVEVPAPKSWIRWLPGLAMLRDYQAAWLVHDIGAGVVLVTGQVAGDGRSDWLKGMQLLAVYLVLALTFFFLPGHAGG